MTSWLRIGLLWLLFVCSPLPASEDRALFWQVQSGNATVYLMGSIHFADDSFYPLRKSIVQAFDAADYLVVEVDMSAIDPAAYARFLHNEGTYQDGQTIRDNVSAETYQKLLTWLKRLDIPLAHVKRQKPGIVVMTLTTAQVVKMGLDPSKGIDFYFIDKAKGKKRIIALETLEQQLRIFLDIADGDLLLKESLHSMGDAERLMMDMVTMWKQGDEDGLDWLLFEESLDQFPAFASLYDELFYRRNHNMTAQIRRFLQSGRSYFVVVGAGHLVGEQGIVNLLRKAGYKPERR